MFGSRYVVGSPNTWNETSSSLRGATYGMQTHWNYDIHAWKSEHKKRPVHCA